MQGRRNAEDIVQSFKQLETINCQHYPMTFIPGFSAIRGDPMPEEENAKFYEETQEQRGLERKLRAERRDYDILKAMGASEEELERQRARVDEASNAIDTFCDKTGHPRRRNREWTPVNAKFPPKNSYDPATFPTEVRDKMQDFFKGGMNLHENIAEQIAKPHEKSIPKAPESTFAPAKTIAEAEKFAETFVDNERFGAIGVSYKGLSVDVANVVNKTMSDFYNQYKVEKFGGVMAPAGNTQYGKMMQGKVAGYMPTRHSVFLNRKSLKTLETAEANFKQEKEIVKQYLANPDMYYIKSREARRVFNASKTSGRATVPSTAQEAIWHELGHSLERPLRSTENFERIKEGFQTWAEKVSGYATTEFSEYIAESFCAWNKGEEIDPELITGFMALRR